MVSSVLFVFVYKKFVNLSGSAVLENISEHLPTGLFYKLYILANVIYVELLSNMIVMIIHKFFSLI